MLRFAPLAVLLSSLASAQSVEKPVQGGAGTGTATPAPGTGNDAPSPMSGRAAGSAPSLQGNLPGGVVATPVPTPGEGAAAAVPRRGGALAITPPVVNPPVEAVSKRVPTAPSKSYPVSGVRAAPSASSVLRGAARGVEHGRSTLGAGGDGLSVRQALDRAFDASVRGGVLGQTGVAGRFQSAREKVAGLVDVANTAPPADAPDLYRSAIKTAQDLPSVAASAVTKAVLSFAARKAEVSLSDLAEAAFTAAAAGQASEAGRFVKSLDKWEKLLGAPGRPLLANGELLKAGVARALADAPKTGAKATAARVWVEKRGGSYVAVLPGSAVEKVPGLAASFALMLEALPMTSLSDAYRAFAAAPYGSLVVYRARRALGDSAPTAALSAGEFWLKSLLLRAWNALLSLLPSRALPAAADAASLPRLISAARSWRDAAGLGAAAARLAGSARTVSRARGAFALARRAAAAHEALTGESGAFARVDALARDFEAGVAREALSPVDRLTPGLETIVAGDGGLLHWVLRHADDARARAAAAFTKVRGAGPVVLLGEGPAALAAANMAASKTGGLRFVAFDTGLWASGAGPRGTALLSADLRSTEAGGSVSVQVERGDEALARALDGLGFAVRPTDRGGEVTRLKAILDAETVSADASELAARAAEAAALIAGGPVADAALPADLERLLFDVRRVPGDAAKTALLLDGRSWAARAQALGLVGELEAVAAEVPLRAGKARVTALRDPDTGLARYARAERPSGAALSPAVFAELLLAP